MKRAFFMVLIVAAGGCKRGPEGTEPGDCDDEKDNDFDGRYDCEDDGCAMDDNCVKMARDAEEAQNKQDEAARARVRQLAEKAAKAAKAAELGPTFILDGLMVQTTQNGGDINWIGATKYCEDLKLLDHTDWRLPTREEAVKIIESGQLKSEASYVMWTSTEKGNKRAVIVGISGAVNDLAIHYDGECRARCVRGALTN